MFDGGIGRSVGRILGASDKAEANLHDCCNDLDQFPTLLRIHSQRKSSIRRRLSAVHPASRRSVPWRARLHEALQQFGALLLPRGPHLALHTRLLAAFANRRCRANHEIHSCHYSYSYDCIRDETCVFVFLA